MSAQVKVPEVTQAQLKSPTDMGERASVAVTPTQMRRPWRATTRTIFAGVVAAAALLPFVVQASGLDPEVYPWLAGLLAVAGAVTRVMALPQVESFLRQFLPFLAAAPSENPRRRVERGAITILEAAVIAILVVLVLILFGVGFDANGR